MQNFIVLGLVPGTDIQISFLVWLAGALSLAGLTGLRLAHGLRLMRNWLITAALVWATHRLPLA
ncbi:MAG: hypothetical protein ACREGF_00570 [Candidatus Saccharimonadales bacterium]